MPIKKAAFKAMRQAKKRMLHNDNIKSNIDYLRKKSLRAIEKQEKEAAEFVKKLSKAVDKAIQKKIFKRNTGDRIKSKMMKRLNAMLKK
ncbi:MAG: 30S ribosomal protein S20 [Patescibacteria group bacterium]|nr:30S ribosomal protein S20 [Patescibacteria group bacterium]MDD5490922.1 30S ribosomal protein S20 [Patescibacteria group bacterium]